MASNRRAASLATAGSSRRSLAESPCGPRRPGRWWWVLPALLFAAGPGGRPAGAAVAPPGADRRPSGLPLEFDSEFVRLVIRGDSLEVEGLYDFVCRSAAPRFVPMLYPFPVDDRLGGARMVSLAARDSTGAWRPLAFEAVPTLPGAAWRVPIGWADTLRVRAIYRQALRGRYARYIVTTTGSWSRPLRIARFEIALPDRARPTRFSYPFAPAGPGTMGLYRYEAADFQPARDIEVEWSE